MASYCNGPVVSGEKIHEVRCAHMSIRVGERMRGILSERFHGDHRIVLPFKNSSFSLSYHNYVGKIEQLKISDKHVCIFPAQHSHNVVCNVDSLSTVLTFSPEFLWRLAIENGLPRRDIKAQYSLVDPFLWHMIRSIEHQFKSLGAFSSNYIESVAVVIGRHLLHTYARGDGIADRLHGLQNRRARQAIEYIGAHYHEDIGFKDIAAELEMSAFHFSRMFKNATSETPQQYIMRLRIEAAKILLLDTDRSIVEIALAVGYKSQSYFTTRFSRLVGITPAVFRGSR